MKFEYDDIVSICEAHGICLPVECVEMVVEITKHALAHKAVPVAQPSRAEVLTDAARDVLAERQRQISKEGWTPEHDDDHRNDELSLAAACYALEGVAPYTGLGMDVKRTWPLTGWDWSWWKPKDRRRNLIKAGALILAEIERIDRKAKP